MALLPILRYPDPRLKTVADAIASFDYNIKKLAEDMLETMYAAPGIGLAATQVNIHKRLIVMDISETKNNPIVMANPRIISHSGILTTEEGCLSVPGIYDSVERFEHINVRFQDVEGETHFLDAEGLLAVCIQHEIDHLAGRVFVDYLSRLKQGRIKSKLLKQARITA